VAYPDAQTAFHRRNVGCALLAEGWLLRKQVIIASAFFLTTIVGAARAGDLPVPMPVKAPVPVAAPWSWTGFYIGAHIGGALETSSFSDPFGPAPFGDNVRSPAFIGGGQIGGNYQIGRVVLGAEASPPVILRRFASIIKSQPPERELGHSC
jgi:hypothetical protein